MAGIGIASSLFAIGHGAINSQSQNIDLNSNTAIVQMQEIVNEIENVVNSAETSYKEVKNGIDVRAGIKRDINEEASLVSKGEIYSKVDIEQETNDDYDTVSQSYEKFKSACEDYELNKNNMTEQEKEDMLVTLIDYDNNIKSTDNRIQKEILELRNELKELVQEHGEKIPGRFEEEHSKEISRIEERSLEGQGKIEENNNKIKNNEIKKLELEVSRYDKAQRSEQKKDKGGMDLEL